MSLISAGSISLDSTFNAMFCNQFFTSFVDISTSKVQKINMITDYYQGSYKLGFDGYMQDLFSIYFITVLWIGREKKQVAYKFHEQLSKNLAFRHKTWKIFSF